MIDSADIRAAAGRIAGHVRRTPLLRAELDDGRPLWLKLEHLQRTGSFKVRGATNALRRMDPLPRGVVAASGGNHGLGVAEAARSAGIPAVVVVPEAVPQEKARRLAAHGAEVVRHGAEYAEAEAHARELAARRGLPFLHPFADPDVVAGQGTVGLEIAEDLAAPRPSRRPSRGPSRGPSPGPACDAVVVAIGGGGLIAGIGTALEGGPLRVVGAEPTGIPTVHDALEAGAPVAVTVRSVAASALGARRTDAAVLGIIARTVQGVALVQDGAILRARDWLWDTCRLAVEPGAAVGMAAVLEGAVDAESPCVVVCGANAAWAPADDLPPASPPQEPPC